jgi:hypothetical protein
MTRQVLNRGVIANDGTGDTLRTAAQKIEQNFEELYTKLGDGTALLTALDFDSDAVSFLFSGNKKTTLRADRSTATQRMVYIPNHSGHLLMDSATQTMTNKTLISPVFTTPSFNDSSSTYQYMVNPSGLAADRTITLPLLATDDEFTFNDHSQVLKNKIIQNPIINNPIIGGAILDSSSNELIRFTSTASAVTHLEVQNEATSTPVSEVTLLGAGQSNTNLSLQGNGTGGVKIDSKLILQTQGLNATGQVNAVNPLTYFNIAVPASHTLASGTTSQNGEIKYILNKGTGVQTINDVSNNIANWESITLHPKASCTLVWLSPQWHVLNTFDSCVLA